MRLTGLWLLVAAAVLSLAPAGPSAAAPAEEVLVKVNEVPITRRDLEIEQAQVAAEMHLRNHSAAIDRVDRLKNELVENLIHRELLYQKAQDKKLRIRNRWIERALAELKEKIGGQRKFKTYLEQARLDEKELRQRLRKGLIVQRLLRREVVRQIKVSEAEMQAFFRQHPEFFIRQEQVRVRHILVKMDKDPKGETRGQALLRIQSLQKMLNEGKRFAPLALQYSDDTSRAWGGDLGYLARDQMIPSFARAAFALQTGEVSDIVETRLGFHLIQMVDRTPSNQMAYRDTRDKIERTLRRNKEKKAADAYLARLKNNADIQRLVKFRNPRQ